jgi:hypothetical protein
VNRKKMTSYEMQPSGSHLRKHDETSTSIGGFYRCLIGLSAVQLFCGIAALALGIANAIVCGMLGSIGYGIWGSVIYFVAGSTGIVAFMRQTRCSVGTHLIMSIIAACTAAVQLGMGAGSAAADYSILKASSKGAPDLNSALVDSWSGGLDYFFKFGCSDEQRATYWTWQATGPTVTDALLASFGAISGILAILTAVYSCRICICPPGVSLLAGHVTHTSQMTIVTKA